MLKKVSKALAIIVAVVMVLTMMPLTLQAGETPEPPPAPSGPGPDVEGYRDPGIWDGVEDGTLRGDIGAIRKVFRVPAGTEIPEARFYFQLQLQYVERGNPREFVHVDDLDDCEIALPYEDTAGQDGNPGNFIRYVVFDSEETGTNVADHGVPEYTIGNNVVNGQLRGESGSLILQNPGGLGAPSDRYNWAEVALDLDNITWPHTGVFVFRVFEHHGTNAPALENDTWVYSTTMYYLYVYISANNPCNQCEDCVYYCMNDELGVLGIVSQMSVRRAPNNEDLAAECDRPYCCGNIRGRCCGEEPLCLLGECNSGGRPAVAAMPAVPCEDPHMTFDEDCSDCIPARPAVDAVAPCPEACPDCDTLCDACYEAKSDATRGNSDMVFRNDFIRDEEPWNPNDPNNRPWDPNDPDGDAPFYVGKIVLGNMGNTIDGYFSMNLVLNLPDLLNNQFVHQCAPPVGCREDAADDECEICPPYETAWEPGQSFCYFADWCCETPGSCCPNATVPVADHYFGQSVACAQCYNHMFEYLHAWIINPDGTIATPANDPGSFEDLVDEDGTTMLQTGITVEASGRIVIEVNFTDNQSSIEIDFHLRHLQRLVFERVPYGSTHRVYERFVPNYEQSGVYTSGGNVSQRQYLVGSGNLYVYRLRCLCDQENPTAWRNGSWAERNNGLTHPHADWCYCEEFVLVSEIQRGCNGANCDDESCHVCDAPDALNSVRITNQRNEDPPMGVFMSNLPFIGLMALAGIAFLGYIALKMRKDEDEDEFEYYYS